MLIIGAPISNGVANRILFSDANTLLAVDSNLVWDNTTKRLGIGTTSPQKALHVIGQDGDAQGTPSFGTDATAVFQNNSEAGNNNQVYFIAGTTGQIRIHMGDVDDPDKGGFKYDNSTNSFIIETLDLDRMTIDGFGNVGIGTTSPLSGLQMGNDKLFAQDVNAGLTAGTTQTQAGGLDLTAQVNQISTVANTNDAVVLPVLPATGSISVTIINNGANTMRVFPGSGDDLGAGVNAVDAVNIPIATARTYVSYDGTTWQKYLSE